MTKHFGATPDEWTHFAVILGLWEDLLPTVCDPSVPISAKSTLKEHGRTPSIINGRGEMAGIKNWTTVRANGALEQWSNDPRLGTCLQTRLARGIDIDVADAVKAAAIVAFVEKHLGFPVPVRRRENTGKRLVALIVRAERIGKRTLTVDGGQIEFLGDGQMFVAAGARKDGSRYYWDGGLPGAIPEITPEQYEDLLGALAEAFGSGDVKSAAGAARRRGNALAVDDPVADWLEEKGEVLGEQRDGTLNITCPWRDEHTSGEDGDSSTVWFRAGSHGYPIGHFRCLHSHCEGRNRSDFLAAVGYQEDLSGEFDVIEDTPEEQAEAKAKADRFRVIPAGEFARLPPPSYFIQGVWPRADLLVVYGDSGSGKSFVVTDMAMAIARGLPWRGLRVQQGKVVYVVAEGSGGYSQRLKAYAMRHEVDLGAIPFGVMPTAPNLLVAGDLKGIVAGIRAAGGADIIIFDTLAQVTPGANENSAEDMGLAIANSRAVARAVGGMAVLIHHSGKDASKGARGWSGLRAAADAQLEVIRLENGQRVIQTTKQKDGKDDGRWGFALEDVVVTMDEHGEAVSSCVVVEAAAPVVSSRKGSPTARKLGVWESLVMETMSEMRLGGGDVLLADLVMLTAEKRADAGSVKFRRASAKRAVMGLAKGADALLVVEECYVFERE